MIEKTTGLLLIDKPHGWTSFDVVKYVRNIVAQLEEKKPKNVKVGHTGTLDPAATGLLLLCVGVYTKKVPELIKQDKTYLVEMTLGKNSSTGDSEGQLTDISDSEPTAEDVIKTIDSFVGFQMQVPPAFSAIKVNGKRAYELARAGKEVALKPREITIHSIKNITYSYPHVHFSVNVSSGTYIRSLVQDIGNVIRTGAYMSALRRQSIGVYNVKDAISPKLITVANIEKHLWKTD